jgi:hypothetical protein
MSIGRTRSPSGASVNQPAPFKRDHDRSENWEVVTSEGERSMPPGKKFPAEQIIGKLREAEVELSPG